MIGSDFECFMRGKNGEFVSSGELTLPDKFQKHIPLLSDGKQVGFIHRDNVSVEMCIPAVSTFDSFCQAVRDVIESANAWIAEHLPDVQIGTSTTETLSPEQADHKCAQELGCDVDYLSDLGRLASVERGTLCAADLGFKRYAGGHVHISYRTDFLPPFVAAMLGDLLIGMPSRPYLDMERAPFYGHMSLHRPTKYPGGAKGVEYRPLDSGWVHTNEGRERVANGAMIVNDILALQDHDAIGELMRIRTLFPERGMLVDISEDDSLSAYHDAVAVASRYVEVHHK